MSICGPATMEICQFLQDLVFYIHMLLGANPMWQPTVSIRAPSLHLLPLTYNQKIPLQVEL